MFLSIIIPVYNCEKHIAECLDSCLAQDIPEDDYEILCVNDGSTDSTAEIISAYALKSKNVKLFTKENGGVGSARNLGLDHAKGDYVWFVDADDFIEENILAGLKSASQNGRIKKFKFGYYAFHTELTMSEKAMKSEKKLSPSFSYGETLITDGIFLFQPIKDNKLRFNSELSHGEDTLFAVTFRSFIGGDEICFIRDLPYYYIRLHEASATASHSHEGLTKSAVSYMKLADALKKQYDEGNCSRESRVILADHYMMALRKCLDQVAKMDSENRRRIKRDLKSRGLFPHRQPDECTYTWQECAREPSSTGPLRNIFRYYSIYPAGLFLASVPYTAGRAKVRLSRSLLSSKALNSILDVKNRLLGR